MKLISMTDFVLEQSKLTGYDISDYDWIIRIVNYAKFLKQPLKLEMFVPCVNGEPFNYSKHGNTEQYEKAKEKVLFESFLVLENEPLKFVTICFNKIILTWSYKDNDFLLNNGRTIERFIKSDLTLTENALKQIGI